MRYNLQVTLHERSESIARKMQEAGCFVLLTNVPTVGEMVHLAVDTLSLYKGSILDLGREIKKRIRNEIGEWLLCSIDISTNRFLAKLAASLHKPDGLDVIDHTNVLEVYKR